MNNQSEYIVILANAECIMVELTKERWKEIDKYEGDMDLYVQDVLSEEFGFHGSNVEWMHVADVKCAGKMPFIQTVLPKDRARIVTYPIPTWALHYLATGDTTGLYPDEKETVDTWRESNGIIEVKIPDESDRYECYTDYSAFGNSWYVLWCKCVVNQ